MMMQGPRLIPTSFPYPFDLVAVALDGGRARADGRDEDDAQDHRQHRRRHVVRHRPTANLRKKITNHFL